MAPDTAVHAVSPPDDATPWRLIEDGVASGPFNMGMDEALLRTAVEEGIPTLRFYTWDGPWLSLGYAQRRVDPVRLARWEAAGVGVVRRTTGGRAVLHGCDLTYSVAAPRGTMRPGLRDSYDQVATALLEAIRELGAGDAMRAPARERVASSKHFDCFAEPAGDETVIGREKLVGSAQRRRGGALLQHGSIRIAADPPEVVAAAGVDPEASVGLAELGIDAGEAELRQALARAFARVLGVHFEPGRACNRERAQAHERAELHASDPISAPRTGLP